MECNARIGHRPGRVGEAAAIGCRVHGDRYNYELCCVAATRERAAGRLESSVDRQNDVLEG